MKRVFRVATASQAAGLESDLSLYDPTGSHETKSKQQPTVGQTYADSEQYGRGQVQLEEKSCAEFAREDLLSHVDC